MMVYHYEGLNVNQLDELRDKMREVGALLKVTKNRITKLALKRQLTLKLKICFLDQQE